MSTKTVRSLLGYARFVNAIWIFVIILVFLYAFLKSFSVAPTLETFEMGEDMFAMQSTMDQTSDQAMLLIILSFLDSLGTSVAIYLIITRLQKLMDETVRGPHASELMTGIFSIQTFLFYYTLIMSAATILTGNTQINLSLLIIQIILLATTKLLMTILPGQETE